MVMAPTRELAQQIEEETVKFAHFLVSSCEFVRHFFLVSYVKEKIH